MIKRSIIARISTYMFLVYFLAFASILTSFTITERTRGDAAALNVAGSMRMQAVRIINTLNLVLINDAANQTELENQLINAVDNFSERIRHADLLSAMPKTTDQKVLQQYQKIEEFWFEELKPSLLDINSRGVFSFNDHETALEALFVEVDHLVSILEDSTENKLRLLLFAQFTCLVFAILIILVSVDDLRKKIIQPLRRLMFLVGELSQRRFDTRSDLKGDDELSTLGKTFDEMAKQLSASYSSLEASVQRKTIELERSHKALQLLHDASHHLYENGGDLCRSAVPILKTVEKLLNIGPTSVYLTSEDPPFLTHLMTTQSVKRPAYCKDFSCNACIQSDGDDIKGPQTHQLERLVIPIYAAKQKLGSLETHFPKGRTISDRALKLLGTLADQLGTAVFIHNKSLEKQKLSLLEERTVIARELHDSLAQSLSYLKMQVSRLQKVQQKETSSEIQVVIIEEIRSGLNNAYAQLRELLTTFRLQLNKPSLKEALEVTANEFAERMNAEVKLNIKLPHDLLNPNEEVHLLQITREALSNALKHSQATLIEILLNYTGTQVLLTIQDNGVGLKDGKIPENHYGLIIMRDRSMTLGGQITIVNRAEGGVKVTLIFQPTNVSSSPAAIIYPAQKSDNFEET